MITVTIFIICCLRILWVHIKGLRNEIRQYLNLKNRGYQSEEVFLHPGHDKEYPGLTEEEKKIAHYLKQLDYERTLVIDSISITIFYFCVIMFAINYLIGYL